MHITVKEKQNQSPPNVRPFRPSRNAIDRVPMSALPYIHKQNGRSRRMDNSGAVFSNASGQLLQPTNPNFLTFFKLFNPQNDARTRRHKPPLRTVSKDIPNLDLSSEMMLS
uniref:Uncharacterized protein n=1 Tax=Plectus sambesii TaxID=2011161 RepID=A0A914UMZ5_9BILA